MNLQLRHIEEAWGFRDYMKKLLKEQATPAKSHCLCCGTTDPVEVTVEHIWTAQDTLTTDMDFNVVTKCPSCGATVTQKIRIGSAYNNFLFTPEDQTVTPTEWAERLQLV